MNHASFLREDAARTERWAHLTEGVKSDYQKKVLESMLDSQNEINGRYGQFEATDTSDVAVFTRISKALVRRIMPALVANELVSIQPLKQPTAKVFYLDFKLSDDLAPTAAGDRIDWESGKGVNKTYSSGVIRGERIGTGNGVLTTFQLKQYPIKAGTLVLKKDSVAATGTVDALGVVTFTVAPANGAVLTADYALTMEGLGTRGNAKIAELELEMSSATVETESKKIKARWTIEAEQDFEEYHGLSLETELTKQLGDQVKREIDRMIIDDLVDNASAGNSNWSRTIPAATLKKDHYETLVHAIGDVSNEIYKKRLRHATFVIMSPDNANLIDKLNTFRMGGLNGDGAPGRFSVSAGPAVFGTLTNRYNVIVDPSFSNDKILVGAKGVDDWSDTGYVYAPYKAFATQTFIDPNTMMPVKGLLNRFGRHLVNGDFYGTVTLTA